MLGDGPLNCVFVHWRLPHTVLYDELNVRVCEWDIKGYLRRREERCSPLRASSAHCYFECRVLASAWELAFFLIFFLTFKFFSIFISCQTVKY